MIYWLRCNGTSDPHSEIGAFATECVRKTPCRVMIVRKSHTEPFDEIVAFIDFSDLSPQVIDQVICVSRQDSVALHLIHVFASPWDELHYMSPTTSVFAGLSRTMQKKPPRRS